MLHLHDVHWHWLFGALSLGTVIGWSTYLVAATRWDDRPAHIAMGAVAIGVLLAVAAFIPARYGIWIELGVVLAVVGAIGCCVGWVLRDIADFTPAATRPAATASAVAAGSYLYRDAFAGMGTSPAFMRTTAGQGGPARVILPPDHDDLAKAPAPGGYTFPRTLPFSDVTVGPRSQPIRGTRAHWTWRAQPAASDVRIEANDLASARETSPRAD